MLNIKKKLGYYLNKKISKNIKKYTLLSFN